MKQDFSISIYLDKRRPKANGKYPVKLRVYTSEPRIQKMYPTIFNFTEKEFNSIWNTSKPRKEFKKIRKEIEAVEVKADKVAKNLNPFSFEQFERQLYRKSGEGIKVKYHFEQLIYELTEKKQIGTASLYELSQKSIKNFVEIHLNKKYNNLTLYNITEKWLEKYEFYMINIKGKSPTTVSMYIRVLRAIYNKAIKEKEIEREYYPFGEKKYQIPAVKNVKKALTREQLKTLFEAKPRTIEQKKAKDFWFFSYACNGMNVKDIALLKYRDVQNDKIIFYRAKTKNTSKSKLKQIIVYLNEFTSDVIKKYGNKNKYPDSFVFNILTYDLTPKQQQIKIKSFTRFINQHIKKICIENDLPEISTYWARHSFATNSIRNGASMEFIQESLGHKDLKTTQIYFEGFEDETKKEFANKIMDF